MFEGNTSIAPNDYSSPSQVRPDPGSTQSSANKLTCDDSQEYITFDNTQMPEFGEGSLNLYWPGAETFDFDFSESVNDHTRGMEAPELSSWYRQTEPALPSDLSYLDMLHKQSSECQKLQILKKREQIKLRAIKSANRLEAMKIELERVKLRQAADRKTWDYADRKKAWFNFIFEIHNITVYIF